MDRPHQTTSPPSSMSENAQPPRSPKVSTPPTTYIFNSHPSTPLPATISKYTAYGFNWGVTSLSTGGSEDASSSEFPWGVTSTTAALVSPPVTEVSGVGSSSAAEYMQRAISSPPESPFLQDHRAKTRSTSRKQSSSSKLVTAAPKTSFRLNLPPINQRALLHQAEQQQQQQQYQHLRRQLSNNAFSTAQQPPIDRVTLRSGLPSTILEGQILSTDSSSVPRHFLVRRRSHNDSFGVGLRGVGGSTTLSPATVVQSGTHLQVISGGLPLALLTPPDEERVITWKANNAIAPTEGRIDQAKSSTMERPQGDEMGSQEASKPAENNTQAPSSSTTTSSQGLPATASSLQNEQGSDEHLTSIEDNHPVVEVNSTSFWSGFGQDVWLREALKILLIPPGLPVRTTTEAVRLIAYTLPCPLPPPSSSAAESPSESTQSSNLPSSAVAAPAVAAAAGYTLSAAMASMCHNSDNAPLQTPGGTMIIRPYDGTSTALHTLTSAIQRMYEDASKRVYIHVSHAISPNTPITQIPSPSLSGNPATPHSAGFFSPYLSTGQMSSVNGADGYFSNIFNSIVVAHEPAATLLTPGVTSPATPGYFIRSPMPNPILPPLSLHYSLLERYIPPPTPTADAALFSPKSSLLLDRVFELSPNGGSLLFIYPTRTGARQFCERYLGKVLDPLLRRLMVLYRLRDDLLWSISRMVAVEQMQEYEGLKSKVDDFCAVLSGKSRGGDTHQESPKATSHSAPSSAFSVPLSVVYAEKLMVRLNDVSWRKWWTQQEYARIREVIKGHFSATPSQAPTTGQSADDLPHDMKFPPGSGSKKGKGGAPLATAPQYSGPADLAREILDGVKASTNRPSSRGMGEAVFASAMVGNSGSWAVVGEGKNRPTSRQNPKEQESEGIEVGVFVIRRTG